MSQYNNPSTVSNGLVFAYDQANLKSYKGPPLKNFLTQIEPRGISDNGSTFRFFSGTEQVYIPEIGTLNSAYVDMYNDYNGGSNNCCPSPYGYGQGLAVTGNTQYTYGILYKSYNRYTNPNWMYHYEYGPSGYITEYGVHMVGGYSGQETHLGDDWYWSRAIFTTNSNCNTLYTGSWMYQYGTWNRFYVAKVVLLEGNWLQLHPKYWPDINTTRTSSENIKSLVDSTSITANNLTYNSNSTFSFNGSNGYLNRSNFSAHQVDAGSLSVWAYPTANSGDLYVIAAGGTVTYGASRAIRIYDGHWCSVNYGGGSTEDWNYIAPAQLNLWTNIVYVWSGKTINFYINGVLYTNTRSGLVTPTGNVLNIGATAWGPSGYWPGQISTAMVYNRPLTSQEVQQNFAAQRGRYGI